jgi:hypothetical protein
VFKEGAVKRSNPARSVPRAAQFTSGEGIAGDRSRTDFAGASSRRKARLQLAGGGTAPVGASGPRPPPLLSLHQDLADELAPAPVYGQYPRGLLKKLLPWMRCARHEILHVCSGSLRPGEGIRVDIRPEAHPDILADGRNLPLAAASVAAVMIDPPYNREYAKSLYGVDYPRPSHLLREAARVVRPSGRIALVHYITPKPVRGTRIVRVFGLSTGFDMPMRSVAIYERDQVALVESADVDPPDVDHVRNERDVCVSWCPACREGES